MKCACYVKVHQVAERGACLARGCRLPTHQQQHLQPTELQLPGPAAGLPRQAADQKRASLPAGSHHDCTSFTALSTGTAQVSFP